MADPGSIVTYHDSHDSHFDFFNYIYDGPNPSLADLSSPTLMINNQPTQGIVPDQAANGVLGDLPCSMDTFIHPDDPSLWNGLFDGVEGGNPVPVDPGIGPSMAGTSGSGDFSELLNMMGKAVPVWPPDPVQFYCSCCTVLRELIHSNGICTTKLEIHGRVGNISHAVLEIRDNAKSYPAVPEYQMFDFCKKNIMDVEQFMRQYCNDRSSAGFTMLPDPLSLFYRSLCVGFEWSLPDLCNQNSSNSVPDNLAGQETDSRGRGRGKGKARAECAAGGESSKNGGKKQSKSALSKQRARTKSMTLKDFKEYFHLPIKRASKEVDLCPTVVKKICRESGVRRWPYRKLRSYIKRIKDSEPFLNSSSPEIKANAEAETKIAEDLIAKVYALANRPRR